MTALTLTSAISAALPKKALGVGPGIPSFLKTE